MPTHLYLAKIKVVPDVGHPRFSDVDSAIIELCFYADDEEDAIKRVEAFPAVSRFELREVEKLGPVLEGAAEREPVFADLIANAKRAGIAWRINYKDVGTDPALWPPTEGNG